MFLQRLFFRLGFIFALAVTIRLIGGLFSPAHPKAEVPMAQVTDRFGSDIAIPASAIETSQLAAPLTDTDMQTAVMIVRNRQGGLGVGEGARMTYPSPNGPVTLTASEVQSVNAEYRRFRNVLAQAGRDEPETH